MSEQKGSQIGTLLITGLLAILGTVAGGVIKGYWDSSLADKKFQTDLVMKALEAEELEDRINSLRFMLETNLIAEPQIRKGLEGYLQRKSGDLPQFKPTVAERVAGVVVRSTEETARFTDYDVFLCDRCWENADAQSIAQTLIDVLRKSGQVGQVRLRKWTFYDEVPLETLQNKLTVIVDGDHGEAAALPELKRRLQAAGGLPELQVLDNVGRPTPWRIGIVVCPRS